MLALRAAGLVLLSCLSSLAFADTAQIGARRDNTLYQSDTGSLSNGAGEYFFSGRTARAELRRGLIAFDIAGAIPPQSTIDRVRLVLYMSQTIAGPQTVSLHRVLRDWGEGSSHAPGEEGGGAPATNGDATWLHTFYPDRFWSTPGGDFDPTPSGSTIVDQSGQAYTWDSTPRLVADVQAWLDTPASNFGWLLRGNELSSATAKRFNTRENSNPSTRPLLIVDYTPIPEPAGLSLALVAGLFAGSPRRGR